MHKILYLAIIVTLGKLKSEEKSVLKIKASEMTYSHHMPYPCLIQVAVGNPAG